MELTSNGFPRRNRLDLNNPAEIAIDNAIRQVEKMPADERLTEAVILLSNAKSIVSDFIDSKLERSLREKYDHIVDCAWNNYIEKTMFTSDPTFLEPVPCLNMSTGEKVMGARQYAKVWFVSKCKTDPEFSSAWNLRFETKDMSFEDKIQWVMKYTDVDLENLAITERAADPSTPSKLNVVEYNNETAAYYE